MYPELDPLNHPHRKSNGRRNCTWNRCEERTPHQKIVFSPLQNSFSSGYQSLYSKLTKIVLYKNHIAEDQFLHVASLY